METILILLLANFAILMLILIILFAISGKKRSSKTGSRSHRDIQKIKEQII